MPHAEVTLTPSASSVGAGREFLARTLAQWGCDDVEWPAMLVLSELATNAVLHAGTDFTVSLDLLDDALRLQVRDGSRRTPRVRHYGLDATTGRGLELVGTLAREWGVEPDGSGKTVWCVLPLTPAVDQDPDLSAFLGVDDLAALSR